MNVKGFFIIVFLFSSINLFAKKEELKKEKESINSGILSGLKFRSFGSAYASVRITDFVVNPETSSEFYVAVASGNIWKTFNNGSCRS